MRSVARLLGPVALVGLVSLAACHAKSPASPPSAGAASDAGATRAAGARREPVTVAIVVDQFSAWVAASRLPELPKDGGFARILREGTWVKTLRYAHAVTDTAPGHAALHTGKVPAEHGIFGNEVPDSTGRRVSILRDDAVRAVAPDGVRASATSSSPARLRVQTVADRLLTARPDAYVVSVSLKDRGAILPAGKLPKRVVWFDPGLDTFVTSTAFGTSFPTWGAPVADGAAVARARSRPWELTDRAWVEAHAKTPDDQNGEGDLDGLGITFPHVAKTAAAFRALPASDQMIFGLALGAIEAEYDPAHPTLVLLSLSASDVVGHVFGPDSWEEWDHLRKLDAALGAFLDRLEKRTGPVRLLLAADHGNVSMPEAGSARKALPACAPGEASGARPSGGAPDPYARPCVGGLRLMPDALRDELKATAQKELGAGDWIAGLADPYVFLTAAARALPAPRRATLDKVVRGVFAKRKDAVAEIFDVRDLAKKCPDALARAAPAPARAAAREDVLTLVCRAWPDGAGHEGAPTAGDYYVVPRPGAFFDAEIVEGKGSSHGTPYLYDRTVPMLVRAPGEIPAGEVIEEPVDFSAYAALEAAFVGLDARAPREILASLRAIGAAR